MDINVDWLNDVFDRVKSPEEGDMDLVTPENERVIEDQCTKLVDWVLENQEFAEELGAEPPTAEERQGEALRVAFTLTFLAGYLYGYQDTEAGTPIEHYAVEIDPEGGVEVVVPVRLPLDAIARLLKTADDQTLARLLRGAFREEQD